MQFEMKGGQKSVFLLSFSNILQVWFIINENLVVLLSKVLLVLLSKVLLVLLSKVSLVLLGSIF